MSDARFTRRDVRRLTREIQPDPAWFSRARTEFLKKVEKEMPFANLAPERPWAEWLRLFSPSRAVRAVGGSVIASLSTIAVILGGSIASVSAAETALPGDWLYPVKLAAEQTRLVFTKDKTDRLKLKSEFVTRRVVELKTLATSDVPKKQARIKEATEILKRDLNTVNAQLQEVKQETRAVEAAKAVDQTTAAIATELKTIKAAVGEDQETKQKVMEAQVAAVDTGVKAIEVIIEVDPDRLSTLFTAVELKESLKNKVEGLKEGIAETAGKLADAGISTSTASLLPTSTTPDVLNKESVSSTFSRIQQAETVLQKTEQLLEENRLVEVKDALSSTVKTVVSVDTVAKSMVVASTTASVAASATTSTSILPVEGSTSTSGSTSTNTSVTDATTTTR